MNWYEELGLSPHATPEEIHAAYRKLAALLHPDRHDDPELRRLAESQLKRLNQIYAVLSDPDRRSAYNRSLHHLARDPEAGQSSPFPRTLHVRSLSLGVLLASAVWALLFLGSARFTQSPSTVPQQPQSPSIERTSAPQPPPVLRKALPVRVPGSVASSTLPKHITPQALSQPAEGETAAPAHNAWNLDQSIPVPWKDPAVSHPKMQSTEEKHNLAPSFLPSPPRHPLAGRWLYVPPKVMELKAGLYTAEFVELVVEETAPGTLQGYYRARYRITDRALWPDVRFQFQGKADPEIAIMEWRDNSGSRGELTLRLISSDKLQVDWHALELGSRLMLASGSAILTRAKLD